MPEWHLGLVVGAFDFWGPVERARAKRPVRQLPILGVLMSAPYAGSSAFPASILLPDDGEPIEAGSVNVPFEGVADRTVWLYQRCFAVAEFLVPNPAWVAPEGVAYAIAVGYGGGGGCECGRAFVAVARLSRYEGCEACGIWGSVEQSPIRFESIWSN